MLQGHGNGVRAAFTRILGERGVTVHAQGEVTRVEEGQGAGGGVVQTRGGQRIGFEECIWCTEGAPQGEGTGRGV